MAASGKNTKRRYYTPGVVNGNLARDLNHYERQLDNSGQMAPDEYYIRRRESQAEQLARERAKRKAAVRPAQKVSPLAVLGFGCVAALMVILVMCYVQINAISSSIVSMKQEISALEVEQVTLLTRYEQAFDLATVKAAAQAAGMSQPSDSQIHYIDLPGEDSVVSYSEADAGLFSRIASALGQRVYAVVEYFR